MTRTFLFIIGGFFFSTLVSAQSCDEINYYKSVDFSLSGLALKSQLTSKITQTHTRALTYKQLWNALQICDLDPSNAKQVLLLYGWPEERQGRQSRTRNKNQSGGARNNWNREHTYAKSLGRPNLGSSGPGADAHHIRATDVDWNAARGHLKFADGKGKSGKSGKGWYPGDEWKGDVARMMMYMYVRYQTQCLPANVGYGSTESTPDGMIDLFLKWNAEDPVSTLERQRNTYMGNAKNSYAQGNRNPFIDNPYWATRIWGGPMAENRWKSAAITKK
ncbi:endonuclease I family protein [Flavobacterium sp. JP2137]|uniref:endonuclease I family protein n=1 Tax=Flavobacterium sp. JP2137 TaxID=3414510 RepID=UPI003D3015AC